MLTRSRLAMLLVPLMLTGCVRVKGRVSDMRDQPLTTAKFSVGRPDGVGAFATHDVNERGEFNFLISPTDENALYVYDSSASPGLTMRRIDRSELSQKMNIRMRPASPDMLPGMNINP